MLHGKAITADGRRPDGPIEVGCTCTRVLDGGEYVISVAGEAPASTSVRQWTVSATNLWMWAVGSSGNAMKHRGEQVPLTVGERCVVALHQETSELQGVQVCRRHIWLQGPLSLTAASSLQVVRRLTGKVALRPSAAIGQIEPDQQFKAIAGAKVFLSLKEVSGAAPPAPFLGPAAAPPTAR